MALEIIVLDKAACIVRLFLLFKYKESPSLIKIRGYITRRITFITRHQQAVNIYNRTKRNPSAC